MAAQVQQSVAAFWETCDQTEYAWLKRVPSYDISAPEAAAVLRVTQAQFNEILCCSWAMRTTSPRASPTSSTPSSTSPTPRLPRKRRRPRSSTPSQDGSCAFVVLCYRTDIVLVALSGDGNAQAALVCSSPEIIKGMTADYVSGIAAQYGVSGECTVYDADALSSFQ